MVKVISDDSEVTVFFESPCQNASTLMANIDKKGRINFPMKLGWAYPRGGDKFDEKVGRLNARTYARLRNFSVQAILNFDKQWVFYIETKRAILRLSTDTSGRFNEVKVWLEF